MLLQWHILHAKGVAFMSKDINSLPHTAEGTISTFSVSAMVAHFVVTCNLYICEW